MKRAIVILLILAGGGASAQVTLEECQEKARARYPLGKQQALIEQARAFDLSNANKGYLPRIVASARASYQSEVTRLPVTLPGVNVEELSRDQYQAVVELQQTLWDGGTISARKKVAGAAADAERARVEVDLYAVRERVNHLFFGVLLADEQLRYNKLLQEELQSALEQVSAREVQGLARADEVDAVRVEQARVKLQEIEIRATGSAYREMLGLLTGEEIGALAKPSADDGQRRGGRPELSLFDARDAQLATGLEALGASGKPRVSLFVQGGYGNPGLNMLKNEFSAYYSGGVRLSWDISRLYTLREERRQVAVQQEMEASRRESFLLTLSMEEARGQKEVERWREMMQGDEEIVALHERVAESAAARAREGAASVLDWMREVNRLDQARQARALHEMQWLLAVYALRQVRGE